MAFAFEKLLVYQKSIDFADEACRLTEQFPRGYGFLVDQLNRAALSIAANILELARRRSLFNDEVHAEMKQRLEEIARMLSGLIAGLENRDM